MKSHSKEKPQPQSEPKSLKDFTYFLEQFADIKIMRYRIDGFEKLDLRDKILLYFLSEAALCGRDIIFDQNYKHNLLIRRVLDEIVEKYDGDRLCEDFKKLLEYIKRVWFSNGIHHHYSTDKFFPATSKEYFKSVLLSIEKDSLPLCKDENFDEFADRITSIIFEKGIAPKRVSQDASADLLKASSCNYYENVSEKDAGDFYKNLSSNESGLLSHGINSKLIGMNGHLLEKTWKSGGMYGEAIDQICYFLGRAIDFTENIKQKKIISHLIEYYKTGNLELWNDYNILWLDDTQSRVDFVNGFIETYGDPLGIKASWESVVNFKDLDASNRTEIISTNAQWFEDHSPIDPRFKKKEVKGVSAKVITVAQLGGDCYPNTPIGINLPNADWIRREYGSKSVTMENITYAYYQASLGSGMLEEFAASEEEISLARKYGFIAGNLHTDLHECLGHGSGQVLEGVSAEALKNYYSPLEEARADLFALYYMMDEKLVELGLLPNIDAARAEYSGYIRNGLLTQLTRIEKGRDVEQAHMRNRQLISRWCYEKGKKDNVIEKIRKDQKTFFIIRDFLKLRRLFAELLAEVQRIKSEGDYEAAKILVETYGVKLDKELHTEVLERFKELNIAPYGGFLNPVLKPVKENGEIIDIELDYSEDYTSQMLRYSSRYSFLNPE